MHIYGGPYRSHAYLLDAGHIEYESTRAYAEERTKQEWHMSEYRRNAVLFLACYVTLFIVEGKPPVVFVLVVDPSNGAPCQFLHGLFIARKWTSLKL